MSGLNETESYGTKLLEPIEADARTIFEFLDIIQSSPKFRFTEYGNKKFIVEFKLKGTREAAEVMQKCLIYS